MVRSVLEFNLLENYNYKDGVIYFDGVATKSGLLINEFVDITMQDVLHQEIDGSWLAVVYDKSKIKILSDFFGFSTILYAIIKNKLLISLHYDALLQYLKDKGINPEINYSEIYPYFASNNSLFHQAYSCETACLQIKRLLPTQYIEISNNSFLIKKNETLNTNLSYNELIEIGIKKSRENLKNLQSMGFKVIKQSLSGGKDSRCVLALALDAVERENLEIFTRPNSIDSKSQVSKVIDDDFDIALDIVSTLDLNWEQPKYSISYPISFDNSQNKYRFYRSSNYFNYNFSKYKTSLKYNEKCIELAGGCGEVLRGFWGGYFKSIKRGPDIEKMKSNIDASSDLVFSLLVKKSEKLNDIYEGAKKIFKQEIKLLDGRDFFECIDNHYFNHRNRYHFGNHSEALDFGILLYYPLGLKEFVLASKKLSNNDRANGKLVFDIIYKLNSELHSFGYESDFGFDYSVERKYIKDLAKEESQRQEFKNILVKKADISKNLYSTPSYNLDSTIDIKFNEMLKKCMEDEKLALILSEFKVVDNFKSANRSNKTKLLNKLDPTFLILKSDTVYQVMSF